MQANTAPYKHHQKRTAAICITFLLAFLTLALLRSSLHPVDAAVNAWMPTIQTPAVTVFMEGVAFVFDTTSLVFISVAVSAVLFLKHRKDYGLFLLGAMGGDALLVTIIKTVDQVARPANGIVVDNGFSFPSGHSAGVVVFVGMLAYFAWRQWSSKPIRAGVAGVYGALIVIVGFDRVYLNVHWLSDVFGGWLFGAFWLSFVILLYGWFERRGSFRWKKFDRVANVLYVGAVAVAVLVAVSGAVT
jgi:membrane-associated phospholipid phosphatase